MYRTPEASAEIVKDLTEALRMADHCLSHLECYFIGEGNLLLIKQNRERIRKALDDATRPKRV